MYIDTCQFQITTMVTLTRVTLATILISCTIIAGHVEDPRDKPPTVLIGILVRNKAHTLPYFLNLVRNLEYPKNRISLWIRSDNNIDSSIEILRLWLKAEGANYHRVNVSLDEESNGIDGESHLADWNPKRFDHVIKLREEVLDWARFSWVDYLFMLDADVFLTEPKVLQLLMSRDETVVAPLLKSDGMYSNFWAGMTPDHYYVRTERYKPILNREERGCFRVPMIHSALLINLRRRESDSLTYDSRLLRNYDGPRDDIITFARGANASDIPLYICNDNVYGFVMVPLERQDTLAHDRQQLTNLKLEIFAEDENADLSVPKYLQRFVKYPPKDTLGLDNIFMINLLRRPERRERMNRCFDELGIQAEVIDAVDGRSLNDESLKTWGVTVMPEYADPYRKRPMTMGEIGCFLSHYIVWQKVVQNRYEKVMVLEDDVRFEPFFRQKVNFQLKELERLKIDWDLVYLGRKRMQEEAETWVNGSQYLVHAGYSYWTLGYLLSLKGAKKLLEAEPLSKLVPVDEYLPILFNQHPRDDWKEHFQQRDLVALSTAPLLVYPNRYTGESGYISDTEDSKTIKVIEQREEL